MPAEARPNIFGNMTCIDMTTYDMARLGWLWCNGGRWGGRQVVPEQWIRQSTRVNPVAAAAPAGGHTQYGQGFWCNDRGAWWPNLPRDSFASSGAGWKVIFCCPSLDLVIGESPGVYDHQTDENAGFAARIVAACR